MRRGTRKAGIFALGGVLVAACVGGWAIMRGMADSAEPLPATPPDAAALGMDASVAPVVSRFPIVVPDRVGVSPLVPKPARPPTDMPFNQAVDALEAAARAGDPVAACRLASETWRCWNVRQMASFLTNEERQVEQMASGNLDAAQLEKRIDAWVTRKQAIEQALMSCEGVDDSFMRMTHYDALATESGDPVARMRYLTAAHMYPGVVMRNPELFDHYRTHAFDYFMQALEAGDLEVLRLWYGSTQLPGMMAISAVLPEPWQESAFVESLIAQLSDTQRAVFGPHFRSATPGLDASPEQQVEAARIHARYFAAAQPRERRPISEENLLLGLDEDPQRCEDPPAQ